jgi:hypothetical protein
MASGDQPLIAKALPVDFNHAPSIRPWQAG